MDFNTQNLIGIIKNTAQGRNKAISKDTLATKAGISDREVKSIIHELVVKGESFIGSHPDRGYFWIQDLEDYDMAVRPIESALKRHAERLSGLRKMKENTIDNPGVEQVELHFAEAKAALKGAMK